MAQQVPAPAPIDLTVMRSLVSFWDDVSDTPSTHFIGNGFFIAPGWILTARHVLCDQNNVLRWQRRWVRCGALMNLEPQCLFSVIESPDFDVALVQLASPLPNATFLDLDAAVTLPVGIALTFAGYLAGRAPLVEQPITLQGGVAAGGQWILNGMFSPGHSGSAVRMGARVVGIAIGSNADDRIGHMTPVAAIHKWIDLMLPGGIPPPPSEQESLAHRLADCFRDPVFVECGARSQGHDLPSQLEVALRQPDPANRADECLTAVVNIAATLTSGLPMRLKEQCPLIQACLMKAMGTVVLACVDESVLHKALRASSASVTTVGAKYDATALALLRRDKWHLGLRHRTDIKDFPDAVDSTSIQPLSERELGVGQDEKLSIINVLLLWQLEEKAARYERDDLETKLNALRNRLYATRRRQGEQYLLVPKGWELIARWALLDWLAAELGLKSIALDTPPEGIFLVPENDILSNVGLFMADFEHPPWKP